ncbi:MAG TPA: 1,4-alpha-glucan branching protein GlgB [Gammaproteobacteria bacterium]|jgi:1,4-alpha-glucan branching enzyme
MSKSSHHIGSLPADLQLLSQARHYSPSAFLGPHVVKGATLVRAYLPHAEAAWLGSPHRPMARVPGSALFEAPLDQGGAYELIWSDPEGQEHRQADPYSFAPELPPEELAAFNRGEHRRMQRLLGAHLRERDGVRGTRFAVWAPNAERVSVIGDFNRWDGRCHPMDVRGDSGVWELFVPGVDEGALYKFEIRNRDSGEILVRADPFARAAEKPEHSASRVAASSYAWGDGAWLRDRADWRQAPMTVYEIHAGSWRRHPDGRFYSYRELAESLVPYVRDSGFTHVELMPITEHPYDASWGYQTTGYFAPTARFGTPDDFRHLVDRCHQAGIGVILDWVPGHFPRDEHALVRFDGTALYEHADPRRGLHPDWGTLVFNFGRDEVRSFLISSAVYWLEEFHLDGLRVDAVASMLYLDYGREEGEWLPNVHGGKENLEAIVFLRALNAATHGECPGSFTVAEESTAWPGVTRPDWVGGLGFSMKWNMGWMHDSLAYLHEDPIHRRYHHERLTFGLLYAFSENFVLPFSHDEVVHGKGSLAARMPGDAWQRFANLRLLFSYLFTYPGKKLLFMGDEFGMPAEWSHDHELPWALLDTPQHATLRRLVCDLARLYRQEPALHLHDFDAEGFAWVDCHDVTQSTVSYLRHGAGQSLLVILNFTPVVRHGYRIGVPRAGRYTELLNSDATIYSGSNVGNLGGLAAEAEPWMGHAYSLALTLPPLGALVLRVPGDA